MEEESLLTKYVRSREAFRQKAVKDFIAADSEATDLIYRSGEYVAWFTLGLSGKDFRSVPNGLYISDLIVSFTRTHFIASDLVLAGELIDGATLLRKQFELLARLHELSEEDEKALERKVPNVRALKSQLRRLYGEYSEIAHSASKLPLRLLGRVSDAEGDRTPVYPHFDDNARIAALHLTGTVAEFALWCETFLAKHGTALDMRGDAERTTALAKAYAAYNTRLEGEKTSPAGATEGFTQQPGPPVAGHSRSGTVILFGAGASFGAGSVVPERPPLGNQLFLELSKCFPAGWGALPVEVRALFSESFEQGMAHLWANYSQVVPELMQQMAIYFVQFRPLALGSTLYCRLIADLSERRSLNSITFSTLNYECLLEHSIWNRGLTVNYGAQPSDGAVTVWKLHGGCNLLPEGIGATRDVSFTSGVSFGTTLRPAKDLNEVFEFCLGNNALPPAMCLFMPGKPIQVSAGSISEIQEAWRAAVNGAEAVIVVGVHPNPDDTHLWETLAAYSGTLTYVGDSEAFTKWAAAHRSGRRHECIGSTFETAYDKLLQLATTHA